MSRSIQLLNCQCKTLDLKVLVKCTKIPLAFKSSIISSICRSTVEVFWVDDDQSPSNPSSLKSTPINLMLSPARPMKDPASPKAISKLKGLQVKHFEPTDIAADNIAFKIDPMIVRKYFHSILICNSDFGLHDITVKNRLFLPHFLPTNFGFRNNITNQISNWLLMFWFDYFTFIGKLLQLLPWMAVHCSVPYYVTCCTPNDSVCSSYLVMIDLVLRWVL